MALPKQLADNLQFLIAEVTSQLVSLKDFFRTYAPEHGQRLLDRDGYSRNLKIRIHDSCIRGIAEGEEAAGNTRFLRAVESIATDLDQLSELGRDCIHKFSYLQDPSCLNPADYLNQLDQVIAALDEIAPALYASDTQEAMKIGRIEAVLDKKYRQLLKHYISRLDEEHHRADLVSSMMMAHSLEKMGDVLLHISEAIISVSIGHSIDIERYQDMMDSMERLGVSAGDRGMKVKRMAETRSGSEISGITTADTTHYAAIYKGGKRSKLKEERQGVESWHDVMPGVAPRILSYNKRGDSASLLIEHLSGLTFEQILVHESPQMLDSALKHLTTILDKVWHDTASDKPAPAHFMRQLSRRLEDVYAIHPEFRQGACMIGDLEVESFNTLLGRAMALEETLAPAKSVHIHGDFNLDNIIYDPVTERISFIDLHRSRYLDYVQDVSVFMVSNFRLQGLDAPLRFRVVENVEKFYQFAARYAEESGDETFELRLALGLARSFATSTRFILDKYLARTMFLRARYVIELALACDPAKAKSFKLPIKELFVG